MRQKTSQVLYSYWNDVRGTRMAPRRFEIEPARIADLLPETFILERIDPETYKFRLAGTRICELFGTEFRSRNFLDAWSADDRLTLEHQLSIITHQGAVGVFHVEAGPVGGKPVTFEIVMLPLLHIRDSVDRFLGAFSPLDTDRFVPGERLKIRRLLEQEIIWPDGRPFAVVDKVARQVPFLPHVRAARIVKVDRRQFRVYDGGLAKPVGDKA